MLIMHCLYEYDNEKYSFMSCTIKMGSTLKNIHQLYEC